MSYGLVNLLLLLPVRLLLSSLLRMRREVAARVGFCISSVVVVVVVVVASQAVMAPLPREKTSSLEGFSAYTLSAFFCVRVY